MEKDGPIAIARARLFEWGTCIRAVIFSGAPHPNYYSEQPFNNTRTNFDFKEVSREIFVGSRFDRAIELDEIIQPIKDNNRTMYAALIVRYVERDHGGKRKLRKKDQLFKFHQRTGLGKTAYYTRLAKAETFISMHFSSDSGS